MIISDPQPHRRKVTRLSPWFLTRARMISVRADTVVEVWNPSGGDDGQGRWEEIEESLTSKDFAVDRSVFIDPATMQIVVPETDGAVNAIGFMVLATGRQIGLASLDEGAVYEAMAVKIETFAQVNGFV